MSKAVKTPQKPAAKQGFPAAVTASQYVTFAGTLTDGTTVDARQFKALAGEGAPTVTGGFAKWQVIDRPQRVGLTVLQGYDPLVLSVPILFDAVAADYNDKLPGGRRPDQSADDIETAIQTLEWMGGRGIAYTNHAVQVGHPGQGDSPLVRVFTANALGAATPLIPAAYQTAQLTWIVTGIAYDANPLRNTAGRRIRQAAVVQLTEHVGSAGSSFDSAAVRAKKRRRDAGRYTTFVTTDAINTMRLVAEHFGNVPASKAAEKILAASKGRPGVPRSIGAKMRKGTKLKVPLAVAQGI